MQSGRTGRDTESRTPQLRHSPHAPRSDMAMPHLTAPLAEPLRRRLAALARQHGDVGAAAILGIGRATVARAAAGLAVRPSVAIAIAHSLAAVTPLEVA